MGMVKALKLVTDLGLFQIIFESDCKLVADKSQQFFVTFLLLFTKLS